MYNFIRFTVLVSILIFLSFASDSFGYWYSENNVYGRIGIFSLIGIFIIIITDFLLKKFLKKLM